MEEGLTIEVNIDGSAYRNPGHEGGLAAYAKYSDGRTDRLIFKEGYDGTTNNRMELRAAIRAMEHARALAKKELVQLHVTSDSKYLVENYPRIPYWRSRGWENLDGKIYENIDLWKRILSLRSWSGLRISVNWQEGKTTPENKYVDKQAKAAAKGPLRSKDSGYIKPRVARSKLGGKIATTIFPANGQIEIIRIYEYEILKSKKKAEYRIKFDLYSEDDKIFTDKYFAYMATGNGRTFHRHHSYRVRFNRNEGHPVIEEILEEFADGTRSGVTLRFKQDEQDWRENSGN